MLRIEILMFWLLAVLSLVCPSGTAAVDPVFANKLVRALLGQLPAKSEIELTSVHLEGAIPHNPVEVRITSPTAERGIAHFECVWREGSFTRTRVGTASYQVRAPIAVATMPIRVGSSLGPHNTRFQVKSLAPFSTSGFYKEPSALKPLVAKMYIAPGTVISLHNAEAPPAISAGAMVEVLHMHRNLTLSMRARALQSGRLDEWIRVQHPTTRKILQARVTGNNAVELR